MRLVMIDANERLVESERDGLGGLETDEQRVRQPRALRGGDGVQLSDRNSRLRPMPIG